jgi:hypothetical protein
MTQKEILRFALEGIDREIDREKEINRLYFIDHQEDCEIAQNHIANLEEKFDEVCRKLAEIEQTERKWYNKLKNKIAQQKN